jgi:hypothetical protein
VNAVVIEVRRGRDGKHYPMRMPTPPDERERARTLAHRLHCADGLSFRQVQRALADQHGIRRSLGQLHADLTRFECDRCADAAG